MTLAKDPAFRTQSYGEDGTRSTVRLAVEAGADANAIDEAGNTARYYIVDKGFDSVVKVLAESGAHLGATNHRGQTPLAMV